MDTKTVYLRANRRAIAALFYAFGWFDAQGYVAGKSPSDFSTEQEAAQRRLDEGSSNHLLSIQDAFAEWVKR